MANENISYQEALLFKKKNCYTSVFSYSDIVNRQPSSSNLLKSNPHTFDEDFPILNNHHHFFNSKKPKIKNHHSFPLFNICLPLPQFPTLHLMVGI